ncbi:efflux RND transporter permease subunit [bacterium]|nr:efflux RND transporter permease subunit [bacterium]
MNIISFVIRRKTLVSMLFIGLCLLGIISYRSLPVELIPLAEPPVLIVSVTASQELDPSYIEKEAVLPIEGAIGTLENIDQITANVNARRAMITIEYHPNANIKFAYLRLTEAINNLRNSLPEEFFVTVFKIDTEQLSNTMMVIQARGSGGADRVRQIVDEKITDDLINIDGIASVDIVGGRQKTVEIILNEAACEAQSITPAQIRTAINRQEHAKSFVGYAYEKGRKHFVNFSNEFASVSNLENIVLKTSGPVRLKDVADIFVGVREPETISRINGKEAVTLTLIRDSQANLISVANIVRQQIETLNEKLENDDVKLVIQTDSAEVMEDNIDMIVELGLIGGLLAIVVLWYFLQNLRLVFIVALAIPISILVSFNFFYMYGISINSLTLVGIALAIGMLLDNSVVVLENIYRLLSHKKPLEAAIVQGTREVGRSIFAATLTTITVFLPFMFTDNFLIKLMGKHVSVSIISTLIISLAVALLLIPMLAHKILSRTRNPETYRFNIVSQNNRFVQIYTLFLKFSMRYPARTIIGAIVLFFGTLLLAFTISISSQQDVETNQLDLYVTMAKGATLDKTDAVVGDLEQILKDIPEIKDVVTKIYEDEATVNLQLVEHPEKIKNRNIQGVKSLVQEKLRTFRAASVSFDAPESSHRFGGGGRGGGGRGQQGFMSLLGVGGTSERITIKGHDLVKMRSLADDIKSLMSDNENISNVSLNISDNQPELHLLFDRSAFDYYNITLTDVASELIAFSKETTS